MHAIQERAGLDAAQRDRTSKPFAHLAVSMSEEPGQLVTASEPCDSSETTIVQWCINKNACTGSCKRQVDELDTMRRAVPVWTQLTVSL